VPHVSRFSRRGPPDSRHHAVVALSARVCIAPYRRVETFAIRGAKCPRNPAPEGRPSLAQRFSVCVRTRFRNPVERSTRESSPGGASQRSPALSALGKAGQEVDQMAQPPEESCVATPSGARKWNAIKLQPRSGDTGKPGTSVPGRQRSKRESRQGRHRVATQTPEVRPSSHPRHCDV
jgi:hypothetical protein